MAKEPKSFWNYRMVSETTRGGTYITIREVYYKGGKPWMCTDGGTTIGGEDVEDLKLGLTNALKALDKPVLYYPKDFTEP